MPLVSVHVQGSDCDYPEGGQWEIQLGRHFSLLPCTAFQIFLSLSLPCKNWQISLKRKTWISDILQNHSSWQRWMPSWHGNNQLHMKTSCLWSDGVYRSARLTHLLAYLAPIVSWFSIRGHVAPPPPETLLVVAIERRGCYQ